MRRCPNCEAIVASRSTHCQLCFGELAPFAASAAAAPPNASPYASAPFVATVPPSAQVLPDGYNWKHVLICIASILWILDGMFLILTALVLELSFKSAGFGGAGFIPAVVGITIAGVGGGVIFGQNWAFSAMKSICAFRILFGALSFLWATKPFDFIYATVTIALSAFLIWLLCRAHD